MVTTSWSAHSRSSGYRPASNNNVPRLRNSKDDLALSATAHWEAMTEGFFAAAPFRNPYDPLDRLLGYLKFRSAILTGELPDYACLLGTLVFAKAKQSPDVVKDNLDHLQRYLESLFKRPPKAQTVKS
jgi:glutathione S-transferase